MFECQIGGGSWLQHAVLTMGLGFRCSANGYRFYFEMFLDEFYMGHEPLL